ncbi:MAG TPA: MmgE/PrpD family protein [Candidatus Binatia bacterium]|jgi:2-methylcitrate dehydratase PrpD
MGPTEILAQFVVETDLNSIPGKAVETSKLVILDAVGVTLAAARQRATAIITDYVRAFGALAQAGVIGSDLRTEASLAAWVNGTMAFMLDFDDNLHGSTNTLPAALAAGERNGASGAKLLEAYILGRDVCFRLDAALDAGRRKNHGGPTSRGWFAGGTTGSLAAAAAAGKMLGLNPRQMATAFGIAAAGAGGLRRNFGTMAKGLQTGNAARNGVSAAVLARQGFTADTAILEAPFGLAGALCLEGECDWQELTKDLGQRFYMERLPAIKRFPTCSPAHRPIEGLLALRQEHRFGSEDVERIECDFHERSLCRSDPDEAVAGPNCMPFILAVAVLDGNVAVEQLTDEKMRDPAVRNVMSKIKHVPLRRETGQPEPPDRVTVKLKNGAVHSVEVAERHTLTSKEEIEEKFFACATMALSHGRAERLAGLVAGLEKLADMGALMRCMNGEMLATA